MGGVARVCDNNHFSRETYYQVQRGLHEPTLYTIGRLLSITGLTFEEAFTSRQADVIETSEGLREKHQKKIPASTTNTDRERH